MPVFPHIVLSSLDNLVTSLPQNELCLSLLRCACLSYVVPVLVTLCLSVLG